MQSGIKIKLCPKGHKFYKSSDCPVCPVCEKDKKPVSGFLTGISAPARRALEKENIKTLKQLARWTDTELLQLHGIGRNAIAKLTIALEEEGLYFSKNKRAQ